MDDMDKTVPPRRMPEPRVSAPDGEDAVTIPGVFDRKPAGRFQVGNLILRRYKVLAELGQGGMGVVYKCFDETAGIEVALKALPPELSHNTLEMEDVKENFQLVSRLIHQNIAASKTLERDSMTGDYYLIMECVNGEDLRRWIKRKRKENTLTLESVLPVLKQIAAALDYAHAEKIIHRDIKPGNIMIDASGHVKVLDFGLAAQIHTSMTRVSMAYHGTSGTGPYMAPEQWRGRAQGAPADQYALAVMAYELLAGHLPFESTDATVLREAVLNDTAETLSGVPVYVQHAVSQGMSKAPDARFASCSDFVSALGGAKVRNATPVKSGRGKYLAAGIVLFLLIAGGIGYGVHHNELNESRRSAEAKRLAAEKAETEEKRLAAEAEAKKKAEAEAKRLAAEKAEAEEKRLAAEAEAKKKAETEAKRLAAEKAEAEAKRLAAEAKAEAEAKKKAEAELLKLAQDTYRLQASVQELKREIDAASHDRGQTFGKHLDDLRENAGAGEIAMNRNDIRNAHAAFTLAREAADWIRQNAPLRQKVRQLISECETAAKSADSFESKKLAYIAYKAAFDAFNSAEKAYESGEFTSAVDRLNTSKEQYAAALTGAKECTLKNWVEAAQLAQERRDWKSVREYAEKIRALDSGKADNLQETAAKQEKAEAIEKHLSVAREARKTKEWENVLKSAQLALKLDSSNAEANALSEEAVSKLKPSLLVIPTVNGRRVNAKIHFDDKVLSTENPIIGFTEGTRYAGKLSYQSGDTEYTSAVDFTCDWRGPREITVELKKIEFPKIVDLPSGITLEMVKCPAGTFKMGSPDTEAERSDDETLHQVTLRKPFWLGKTEVTQSQWKAVMGENPSYFKGDDLPVENVSWEDAMKFCEKLNERYRGKLPQGYEFSLPTEAQWEYACRAGTTTALNNGKNLTDEKYNCENLNEVGWYDYKNAEYTTHPVGRKQPNAWGLYDMHGNVWEWCNDWYGSYGGDATDPLGSATGSDRVLRGGSWRNGAEYGRSANRDNLSPSDRSDGLGFRLAFRPVQ